MELRFYFLFQLHGYHCLRDSVRHSGHAEDSDPAMRFRYLHRLHRWRKVTPRRHPIPYPVQIIAQIGLEFLDRAPVHARRSLVGLDSLIRLPYEPLRDTERLFLRLRFAHPVPPRILWLPERTSHGRPGSFAPPLLPRLPHYYERAMLETCGSAGEGCTFPVSESRSQAMTGVDAPAGKVQPDAHRSPWRGSRP